MQDSLAANQSLPKQTHKPQRVGQGLMGRTTHRATHSGFKGAFGLSRFLCDKATLFGLNIQVS